MAMLMASDIFIVSGAPVNIKLEGQLRALDEEKVLPPKSESLIYDVYTLAKRDMKALLPDVHGGMIPAFEIMHMTGAVRNMIRDFKNHQIGSAITSGAAEGMISMDQSILQLYQAGQITRETALEYADNPEQMLGRLG